MNLRSNSGLFTAFNEPFKTSPAFKSQVRKQLCEDRACGRVLTAGHRRSTREETRVTVSGGRRSQDSFQSALVKRRSLADPSD